MPIRRDMPLEKAALLGCAVATGVGAALYTARVQPGDDVAIIGAGGVGLNVVQGARLANARRIIAIDVDDERLALAQRLGATDTVNSRVHDPIAAVKYLTGGRGVEHVFEIDFPLFADWYMDGRLHLDELHTHTITLEQAPALFAEPRAQGGIRTVIRMGDTA